jgi:hypothetical protein
VVLSTRKLGFGSAAYSVSPHESDQLSVTRMGVRRELVAYMELSGDESVRRGISIDLVLTDDEKNRLAYSVQSSKAVRWPQRPGTNCPKQSGWSLPFDER